MHGNLRLLRPKALSSLTALSLRATMNLMSAFRVLNYALLGLLALATLYPFWFIIQASLTEPVFGFSVLWPKGFYYGNYWLVFNTEGIGRAYLITVMRVIVAVPLMLIVTGCAAFALTRQELKGRKTIILYYFITMFVSGGLIPFYMLLKTVALLNTFWVFVFPVIFSVWTMIVMKTSFQGLPEGLVEAGLIDGASYGKIFFRIVLPLSVPMITTLGLFQAVWHWNDFFYGTFFTKDQKLRPLQTFLRDAVVVQAGGGNRALNIGATAAGHPEEFTQDPRLMLQLMKVTPESLKQCYIVVSTIPIVVVYPFIQRYFITGVLIGSIKG